ncbi:LacI family DNA-binding transcriptional regulator [Microbacterium oryzae]|uniref:LacI family DNA-binding transcriptional regulator n=1 Tax=Microbacterium oryzae TaxID=743009 RepID=A0A6I6DXN6_9MICO|nr:LacI family DNA-binding transcriptional regulator [Microbacterium oryzae]QGU27593.1 LacI family DNA-binding transcriptional regulator [Microbacterium oryzae]
MTQKRPTLADVAKLSGMSKTAVSLILNDRPGSRLSPEAAERIRAAAAQLGYKPNPAAQSLRLGKTRSVGFISDEVTLTRYASGMIKGVLHAARDLDHTVLIAETEGDLDNVGLAMESMLDRRVDGLIVGLMGARVVDLPRPSQDIPLVIVNGRTPTGVPSILPDERAAGREVASELIEAGHRRIGIIGELPEIAANPRKSVSIGARFVGIDEAFAAAGIRPERMQLSEWSPAIGHDAALEMLAAYPDLTALLAGNDNVAFGIFQALSSLGLRVPEDVSVISFDDEELAGYLRPGLTTARLPYEEMARLGVEMILGRRELADARITMPLMRRQSVARI